MTRLHRNWMRVLVDDIVRGRIPEGEWLPKEVDLAERFAVSRGVARETIRALEERGVVAVRHGRGAQVRPVAEWDLLDAEILDSLVASGRAGDVVGEALECRRLLEGEAAAAAALRIQPDGARVLTEAFARVRTAAGDGDELADAVSAFRGALVRLSGNRPLGRMLAPLDAVDAAALSGLSRPARRRLVERYERILSSVCAGDGGAARAAVEDDVAATAAELAPRGRARRGR